MRKHIIITIILLLATAFVTVVYFKNLSPPGTRTSRIMSNIPNTAALVFEFNNDKSFYDIFNGNKLFSNFIGERQLGELDTLRRQLLLNPLLNQYFDGQSTFISLHPSKNNIIDLLLSVSVPNNFEPEVFEEISKQPKSGIVITPLHINSRPGYNIYIGALKKRFYIINKGNNILSGSFSKELVEQSAAYEEKKGKQNFVLLSEQQNNNSLAGLYVNYSQLSPLFNQLFANNNNDILKSLKLFPALSALSLNYRSDALMFNGTTNLQRDDAESYLDVFALQQPVINHLKDIFPATTAYSVNFSVSDPVQFGVDLERFQTRGGLMKDRQTLLNRVKAETGIKINKEFTNLLGNEFAIITTRFFEKIAIVSVKDGSKLKVLMAGISTATTDNFAQLSYDKLPFYLLGDAFSVFKRPYYTIIDNYLILASSTNELISYSDTYLNRKFLSKNDQYNQFDDLISGRSNVAFFFHFKNTQPVLKRDLYPSVNNSFENNDPGWKNFYAASWQLTAADKNFYTSLCVRLSTDTIVKSK